MTTKSQLQQELKQNRPFDSSATEALISITRTADQLRRRMTGILEPFGLTQQQYNVLRILRGAGPEGLPTLEIRQRMVESNPGITRLLDRLIAKGWVERQRCPEDRRQVLCWATDSGLEILRQLDGPVATSNRHLMSVLDEAEQKQLIERLDRLRRAIAR